MKILVILGHPDSKSLNHAIADAIREDLTSVGHQVVFHDLYAEGFSPLLSTGEIPESSDIDQTVQVHCGVTNFHRRMFSMVVMSTKEQRSRWIEEAMVLCRTVFKQTEKELRTS